MRRISAKICTWKKPKGIKGQKKSDQIRGILLTGIDGQVNIPRHLLPREAFEYGKANSNAGVKVASRCCCTYNQREDDSDSVCKTNLEQSCKRKDRRVRNACQSPAESGENSQPRNASPARLPTTMDAVEPTPAYT